MPINRGINTDYAEKLTRVIEKALAQYPRTLAVLVNTHLPNDSDSDTPASVNIQTEKLMSRFIDSLKAKIKAHIHRTERSDKRCHDTRVRYFWCREIGPKSGHPHYHMLILVNKDTFHSLGRFHQEGSNLGSYIMEAWLSGLGISPDTVADPERYTSLVHFPEHPLYYLTRDADSQTIYRALQTRLEYIAKHYSKSYCRAVRSVGYSTC